MDGILIIKKEKGFTSHDVVAKLRGILHQKKIGHTGTLDPDATGVLPVCLGRATRVCDMLTDTDKTYEAVLRLGITTDTQDLTGTVLSENGAVPPLEEVQRVIRSFEGPIRQIPPMYSALKVDGKKLVDLARQGKVVKRAPRPVVIHSIRVLAAELPRVRLEVTCSKGTYIRTLCHDIGEACGCGGAMESLIRLRAAGFSIEEARTLSEVEALIREERICEAVIPLERIFAELPRLTVGAEQEKALRNGNPLRPFRGMPSLLAGEQAAVFLPDGSFAAVYAWEPERRLLMPVKMFLQG